MNTNPLKQIQIQNKIRYSKYPCTPLFPTQLKKVHKEVSEKNLKHPLSAMIELRG